MPEAVALWIDPAWLAAARERPPLPLSDVLRGDWRRPWSSDELARPRPRDPGRRRGEHGEHDEAARGAGGGLGRPRERGTGA